MHLSFSMSLFPNASAHPNHPYKLKAKGPSFLAPVVIFVWNECRYTLINCVMYVILCARRMTQIYKDIKNEFIENNWTTSHIQKQKPDHYYQCSPLLRLSLLFRIGFWYLSPTQPTSAWEGAPQPPIRNFPSDQVVWFPTAGRVSSLCPVGLMLGLGLGFRV